MVVLDGTVYQVKADGTVSRPAATTRTPFAAVCAFRADQSCAIDKEMDFKGLEAFLDGRLPNTNVFYAIRITGTFSLMETRSVPPQAKPYPPLAEVTKTQPRFTMNDVSGTIVGFRCPPFVKGINVPGYHLHFISDDRTQGGHILALKIRSGRCDVDLCNRLLLILPEDQAALAGADLSKDRSGELEKVEK